jgi:hypothetical protein
MKTIFRSLGMGMALAAFIAVGAISGFAQADCDDIDGLTALDAKIRENLEVTLKARKVAIESGKQFLEKYASCEAGKDMGDWLKTQVPAWEEWLKKEEERIWLNERWDNFDANLKGNQLARAFPFGKEILSRTPDNINAIIPLAMIGLYESYQKNYAVNAEALSYARKAISMLEAGAKPTRNDGLYGNMQFSYNKEDALSELRYTIAYITYHVDGNKKAALPYYYTVTQTKGANQDEPRAYATIGSYYEEEATKIGVEIARLIERQRAATTDEDKLRIDEDIKSKEALFNAYAERALDAYGRAHKKAIAAKEDKSFVDGLYKVMQDIYKLRFPNGQGMDAWIASTINNPMPDPTSEVKPVTDTDSDSATTS